MSINIKMDLIGFHKISENFQNIYLLIIKNYVEPLNMKKRVRLLSRYIPAHFISRPQTLFAL